VRGGAYARRGGDGPPAWFLFLVIAAIVFGGVYLFRGFQDFVRTGGLGVDEATAQAQVIGSATAVRVTRMATQPIANLLAPTFTPIPACIDFRVTVPNGIVRDAPSSAGAVLTGLTQGTVVCVLGRAEANAEWYLIDQNPVTRRIEEAYMNEQVIDAVNPTLTPTRTPSPLPTVTQLPTDENQPPTATATPTNTSPPDFRPTLPADPNATQTPTFTPSATRTRTPTSAVTPAPRDTDEPPSADTPNL
jgi:hypothetical protein